VPRTAGAGRAAADPNVRVALGTVVADDRIDGWTMTAATGRVTELFGVALAAQSVVDSATSAHQDLLERRAEVAVKAGVDDRVEEAVGVAEPQQETVETVRDARLRVVAPRLDERQQEERKPAGRKRAHYDSERLGCLAVEITATTEQQRDFIVRHEPTQTSNFAWTFRQRTRFDGSSGGDRAARRSGCLAVETITASGSKRLSIVYRQKPDQQLRLDLQQQAEVRRFSGGDQRSRLPGCLAVDIIQTSSRPAAT